MLGRLRDAISEHGPSKPNLFFMLICLGLFYGLYRAFSIATPSPEPLPTIAHTPPPAATPQTKASSETDRVILSLFNPSQSDLEGFSASEHIRERYLTIYISLYLLKGCNESVDSYHATIARRFNAEWSALGHDAASQYNTLNSIIHQANGSYSMLYQNTPCDKRNLPALRDYFQRLG